MAIIVLLGYWHEGAGGCLSEKTLIKLAVELEFYFILFLQKKSMILLTIEYHLLCLCMCVHYM